MVQGQSEGDVDPRGLAAVIVIAALLILAIGAGMLLTHRGAIEPVDSAPEPIGTPAPTTTDFQQPASVPSLPHPEVRIPTPVSPPVDLANRRIGDDCSVNGVVAQWGVTPYAGWVCLPVGN
ncbi:hypothetical protein HLB23_33000 [Nocardia uniformis]|uniref:Uncharacterized protein n=1 Tax=Nocardia uniformis TaxID=53432 RepID=A0A849C783_9NOCA|nr:hypothetical protein [Nocardia uniformis]NNH74613.1 hypothetical protein [Nocardia uniformis]